MASSSNSVCFFIAFIGAIFILYYAYSYQPVKEMFSEIDYKAYDKENEQMFEEYYMYDYKNYDFSKMTDKYGTIINKSVPDKIYSTFVENNEDYNPLEYHLATPLKTIASLNENVDLPTHTLNQKKLKKEIKQNRGRLDNDTINNISNFTGLDTQFKNNLFEIEYSTAPHFDNFLYVGPQKTNTDSL